MLSEPPVIKGLVSRGAFIQENLRKCDWKKALQQFYKTGGQYGNWCGKGPPGINNHPFISSGACGGNTSKEGKWGLEVCVDSGFDESCSRHDQGAYSTDVFGIATKSLCKVDKDFKEARTKMNFKSAFVDGLSRSEADSIAAASCLFDMMPCLRYERKAYWDWCQSWSGGYPCKKTKVGYFTHWPMGDYSKFQDDACGPPGCYSEFGSSTVVEDKTAVNDFGVESSTDAGYNPTHVGFTVRGEIRETKGIRKQRHRGQQVEAEAADKDMLSNSVESKGKLSEEDKAWMSQLFNNKIQGLQKMYANRFANVESQLRAMTHSFMKASFY